MSDHDTPETTPIGAGGCAWAALRAGLWMDVLLFLGLTVVVALRPARWTEVYWVILGTGLYKSLTTGVASYFQCRARLRRAS